VRTVAGAFTRVEADESGSVDEVADLPACESKTLELDLGPGSPLSSSSCPGYGLGMYTDFPVS
jgi:hypothetical protein